jgi:hypothetical protein
MKSLAAKAAPTEAEAWQQLAAGHDFLFGTLFAHTPAKTA